MSKSMSADDAPKRRLPEPLRGRMWQAGQSGNPAGRPKGARGLLAESFVRALYEHFLTHGNEAIKRAYEDEPTEYLKLIARLVPHHVEIEDKTERTADEVRDGIQRSLDKLAAGRDTAGLASKPHAGTA